MSLIAVLAEQFFTDYSLFIASSVTQTIGFVNTLRDNGRADAIFRAPPVYGLGSGLWQLCISPGDNGRHNKVLRRAFRPTGAQPSASADAHRPRRAAAAVPIGLRRAHRRERASCKTLRRPPRQSVSMVYAKSLAIPRLAREWAGLVWPARPFTG